MSEKQEACPHPELRVLEITDWNDVAAGNYRYLCSECGEVVLVPMRPLALEPTTDSFFAVETK